MKATTRAIEGRSRNWAILRQRPSRRKPKTHEPALSTGDEDKSLRDNGNLQVDDLCELVTERRQKKDMRPTMCKSKSPTSLTCLSPKLSKKLVCVRGQGRIDVEKSGQRTLRMTASIEIVERASQRP